MGAAQALSVTTVSVALATYNGARYVEEQVRSILAQDPAPTQLVVADDGSTDGTLDLVRAVAAEFPTTALTVLPPERAPLRVAGNFARAIAAATGDLVALSDQDDRWHPGRLASLVARFDAEPALLLLHHDAELIDAAGAPLGERLLDWLRVGERERRLLAGPQAFTAAIRRNTATGATVVFRRALREQALPIGPGWIHDEWFAAIAAAQGRSRLDERALVDYRQHGANEIGVARPTLRHLVRRMLEPRGDRYGWLSERSDALVARLEALGITGPPLDLARRKAAFERARAAYPASRPARLPAVLARRADYAELSSQGRLDIVRDLMHRA